MNWKEQFDKRFNVDHILGWNDDNTAPQDWHIKDFISKQVIEKLIEDIPDWLDTEPHNLKQQLRDKWLGESN